MYNVEGLVLMIDVLYTQRKIMASMVENKALIKTFEEEDDSSREELKKVTYCCVLDYL